MGNRRNDSRRVSGQKNGAPLRHSTRRIDRAGRHAFRNRGDHRQNRRSRGGENRLDIRVGEKIPRFGELSANDQHRVLRPGDRTVAQRAAGGSRLQRSGHDARAQRRAVPDLETKKKKNQTGQRLENRSRRFRLFAFFKRRGLLFANPVSTGTGSVSFFE